MQISFEQITQEVIEGAAKRAVESILADKGIIGWEERDTARQLISDEVRKLFKEDPEVRQRIREKLMKWLS